VTAADRLRKFRLATARRLRDNETSAESQLWRALNRVPLLKTHFRRQAPIGPYIADFACLSARLLIELDGPSHSFAEKQQKDRRRDAWLQKEGYRVLRFWNQDVFDHVDSVLDTIYAALYGSLDTPPRTAAQSDPPPQGEGFG
jgi:very-short-patch-repair endonuclease